jgi:transaldolase
MAFNQAYLAALAGATYVSIFSGRVQDMGYDVRPVISATRKVIDREGLGSKIIVGSMRHLMDVNEALEAGAHVPTITPGILRKMVWNPRTVSTIDEFNTAWRERGKAVASVTVEGRGSGYDPGNPPRDWTFQTRNP